jgi:hypothetical protein
VAARQLGGEMVIMSAVDSTLFTLNETATLLWQAADGVTPLSEIVERRLCHEFDVPPDQAHRDVTEFVEDLTRRGILLVSDQPFAEEAAGTGKKP